MFQPSLFPELDLGKRLPDNYPCRCPYCERQLTRQGGMHIAVSLREHIRDNKRAVARALIQRQSFKPLPKIQLHPDLEYSMQIEAGILGTDLSTLVNELCDSYLEGELKRLRRRQKRR